MFGERRIRRHGVASCVTEGCFMVPSGLTPRMGELRAIHAFVILEDGDALLKPIAHTMPSEPKM